MGTPDKAAHVAFNPAAPLAEQLDARAELQKASIPGSTPDSNMLALVQYVREAIEEEEFNKSLRANNVVPFPSLAAREKKPGQQSVWLDDLQVNIQGNWYERPNAFGFDAMRTMVHHTPLLNAIIMTRQRQIARFCRPNVHGRGEGFRIALKDPKANPNETQEGSIKLLQDFFMNCGWEKKARQRMRLKRDNFGMFVAKLTRETLTMDSMPIETEWKRDKSLGLDGLYAVDGSTIRLCTEQGYDGDDEIFALQVVQGQVRSAYTFDDLIYVPRNPRADVMAGGYGLSEVELLVRVVTGFLNAFSYNTGYFDKNAIPKGLLHLTGNYDERDMASFRRMWNAMVKGVNNAWALPVLVSKDQESKAAFENFGVEANEMMFAKWMTFLASVACAIYAINPTEINFEAFTAGTSSLSGDDTEEKLAHSTDKGLTPLLAYYEDVFSDYIVSEFGDEYVFRWTGLDDEDPAQVFERQKLVMTVNEMRALDNMDKLDGWGDAPLNPSLMQAWMAQQQQGQEDYGDPNAQGPQAPQPPGGPDFGQPEDDGQQQGEQPQDGQQPQAGAGDFGDGGADFGQPAQGGEQDPRQAMAKAFGLPALPVYGVE